MIGKRIMKRACDLRDEFATFYTSLELEQREELEESAKLLLKRSTHSSTNISICRRASASVLSNCVRMAFDRIILQFWPMPPSRNAHIWIRLYIKVDTHPHNASPVNHQI
ncbi:hypothetical protein OSTOST_21091 [Ostertagia ostertagi]